MGGSSKSQTIGYKYYLGMHLALCHGPVDKILRINVDNKEAWVGECAGGQLTLDAEDLFGGTKREGGVSGLVDIDMGAASQTQNSYLASKLGALVPAFRGVCAAVLRQVYVGMNPYLKPWAFRAQRVHLRNGGEAQWYDEKAALEVFEADGEHQWIDVVGSFADFTLESGYADAFDVTVSEHVLTQPSTLEGHSVLRKSISVAYAPTVIEFKVKLNNLPAVSDDCGEIGLYNQDDVRLFAFGAARETDVDSLNRPVICGMNPCAEIDAVIGDEHLILGHTYQFRGVVTDDGMVCTLVDTETGDLFASKTVSDAVLDGPYAGKRITYLRYAVDHYPTASPNDGGAGTSEFWDLRLSTTTAVNRADMNPAHIIRECLTDLDWGLGYPDADIDDDAFMAAADTLYAEQMGISILWDRQIPIEDFIKEILRHIDAVLYVSRTTGKFVLKLIRDDYDAESVLVLDPGNVAHVDAFKVPALAELVNAVTVKYWDASTGQDASLSVQDVAMVQVQGSTISATSDYPGFTRGDLAARVAARDLRALSTPLVSCTVYANRAAAGLNVGDVFRLDWPDYGAANLILRVTQIALGDGLNNVVRLTCVQDVFGLPLAIHAAPAASEWSAPNLVPSPSLRHLAVEAPYYELVQRMGQSTVDAALAERPDAGYVLIAGDRQGADLNARIMVNAGAGYVDGGSMDFSPSAVLDADVSQATETWAISAGIDLDLVEPGTHAQCDDELVKVVTVTETALVVKRGVLDTVPAIHSAGAAIVFWDDYAATDEIEYVSGETASAKILPSTGTGTLSLEDATADEVVFDQRAWRPYPPGQFQINGAYWPETLGGFDALTVSWAHRDRSQQTDGTLTDYLSASIGPESGTAYTLRIYGETGSLIRTYDAVTGTSQTYTAEQESTDMGYAASSSTALLLNFNGANNSTTFTDEKGHVVTASGNAKISTTQSKFGGASAYFDGTGDYLSMAYAVDLSPGGADFTLEMWVRLDTVTSRSFFNLYDADADSAALTFELGANASDKLLAYIYDGSSTRTDLVGTTTITTGAWHHVALTREGTTYRIFLDGAVEATNSALSLINHINSGITLGAGRPGARHMSGYMDDARLVIGEALYTGPYTVPASELTLAGDFLRLNGKLRVELESVRYAGGLFSQYAVPQLTGWNGSAWIGTLGMEDAYLFEADTAAGAYTALNLNLPYAKVAYGGGIHLALGSDGTCKTSADNGASWTNRTGAPTHVQKLVYLNSQFIALTLYDCYSTPDGITWTLKKTFAYRPLDVVWNGTTWMVVGNSKTGTTPFAATSTDLTSWTDISPTLTNWHGTNLLALVTAAGGTLQADLACVIQSGGTFYLGGRFVSQISGAYAFYPLVYKYTGGTFTDCCPPQSDTTGNDVGSLALVDSLIIAAGYRIAAYSTLSTLTYSSWSTCTIPATPTGLLDGFVSVVANGADGILTTQNGGTQLITADGVTFTAATGVVTDNPVIVGPTGGVTSWQHHDHTVYRTGYGFNYGMYYGGT